MKRIACGLALAVVLLTAVTHVVAESAVSSAERARELIPFLGSGDPYSRGSALYQLVNIGPPAIPPLLDALSRGDSITKQWAATALGYIGEPAIPGLIASLKSDRTRPYAGAALMSMDTLAYPHLLVAMLKRPDVEREISGLFMMMGSRPVPYLIKTLRTKRGLAASVALTNIGEPAIPYLFDELKGPDERMVPARMQLGNMGNVSPRLANAMIPRLIVMLTEQNGKLTRNSLTASAILGQIGSSALPAVEKLLNERSADVRFLAIITLGLMLQAARPALPRLRAMLRSEKDAGMQEHIRITIRHIDSAGR